MGGAVELTSHARARAGERGASVEEIELTVTAGEQFPAKHGRVGFRRNFAFGHEWRQKVYQIKQVEVLAVREAEKWIVVTVLVKYF